MFIFNHDPLRNLRSFASTYAQALLNASLLLGGQNAMRRTQLLIDDIISSPELTRRMQQELCSLHQLLVQHRMHLPDQVEVGCRAFVDLDSSIDADLCILSNDLRDQLSFLQSEYPSHDFEAILSA